MICPNCSHKIPDENLLAFEVKLNGSDDVIITIQAIQKMIAVLKDQLSALDITIGETEDN